MSADALLRSRTQSTSAGRRPFLSSASASAPAGPSWDADVIVIGGGLSGLNAAHWLEKGQLNVLVLEARDRLGGRTNSETRDGFCVDLGGAYVGPAQKRLNALADKFGVKRKPVYTQGKRVVEADGTIATYTGCVWR